MRNSGPRDLAAHDQGDASPPTAETGDLLLESMARAVARAVRAVKKDTGAKRLQDEFFAASEAPSIPRTGDDERSA